MGWSSRTGDDRPSACSTCEGWDRSQCTSLSDARNDARLRRAVVIFRACGCARIRMSTNAAIDGSDIPLRYPTTRTTSSNNVIIASRAGSATALSFWLALKLSRRLSTDAAVRCRSRCCCSNSRMTRGAWTRLMKRSTSPDSAP